MVYVVSLIDCSSESDVDEPTPMVTEQQLHKKLTSCFSNTSEMAISPHRSLQKICNIVGYFMTRGSSSLLREDLSVATLETGLIMFEHVLNYLRYTLEVHYESFKPINELRLDRLRAQTRAIDDRRHSLQRPDNEEEAKERSARLCVYIDDIEYVLQNPATRTKSSKLHMVRNFNSNSFFSQQKAVNGLCVGLGTLGNGSTASGSSDLMVKGMSEL